MILGRTGKRSGRAIVQTAATLFLLSICVPGGRATGLQPVPVSDGPIWTDKPVRVDRKKQSYERVKVERKVPDFTIRPTARVTVFDSASFEENGRLYVLTDAVAVNPKQLCRGDNGRIAACGQQARLFLKRLIANRTLACQENFRAGSAAFVTCVAGEADLAQTLVAKGAAWAATPRLATLQQAAMTRVAGIWIDTECRRLGRCPPPKRR